MSRTRAATIVACLALGCVAALRATADDPPAAPAVPPAPADPHAGKAEDPVVALLENLREDRGFEPHLEALRAAKTVDDPRLVPALVKLLKAPEREVRALAAEALGARASTETRRKAAAALAERLRALDAALAKDVSPKDDAIAVIHALHDLAQPLALDALLDGIEINQDLEIVEARAMAVANVPDAKAIDGLIDQMGRGRKHGGGHGQALVKALRYATGAAMANDVDAWRGWWRVAKPHFDYDAAAAKRAKTRAEQAEREEKRSKKGDGAAMGEPGMGDAGMDDSGMNGAGMADGGMDDGAPPAPGKE